jgi:hypothetical protein
MPMTNLIITILARTQVGSLGRGGGPVVVEVISPVKLNVTEFGCAVNRVSLKEIYSNA